MSVTGYPGKQKKQGNKATLASKNYSVVNNIHSAEISHKQDEHNIYVIMKTMPSRLSPQ